MWLLSKRYAHHIANIFIWGYIMALQGYRVLYLGSGLDISMIQMLLTLRLMAFAWNVYDGDQLNKNKDIHPDFKPNAVRKMPSIIEFYGFCFLFTSVLAGPIIEFNKYMAMTDLSLYDNAETKGKNPPALLPSLSCVLQAIVWMSLHLVWLQLFPWKWVLHDDFIQHPSIAYKWFYTWLGMVGIRFYYYFAWKISEGANVLIGLGWQKDKEGVVNYNGTQNIKIVMWETAQSIRDLALSWNVSVATNLRLYCYLRVPAGKNGRPTNFALYATNVLSALWHGLYPGYLFAFFFFALCTDIGRRFRKRFRPYFVYNSGDKKKERPREPWKTLYNLFGIFVTHAILHYNFMPFALLNWADIYHFYNDGLHWAGHIIMLTTLFTLILLDTVCPVRKPRRASDKTQKKE